MNNDHTEYEGRVLDIDKEAVQRKLADCGAELIARKDYRRYVFNTIPAIKDRWVRLRTDGRRTKLTVKEITSVTVDGVQEWETVVDDFETTLTMLEKMGLKPKGYQENRRELYVLDGVKLSIDEWPGLKPLLEIEGHSKDEVYAMLDKLGLNSDKFTANSISQIYLDELGIDLDNRSELRFEDFCDNAFWDAAHFRLRCYNTSRN